MDEHLELHELEDRTFIAGLTGETAISTCGFGAEGNVAVAGEVTGRGHFLELRRPPPP